MSDEQIKPGDNSKAEGVEAANRLVDRLQDEVGQYLKPETSEAGQDEAVGQMIGDLEASPEVRAIREAGGEDPAKFGSGDNESGPSPRRVYDEAAADEPNGEAEAAADADTRGQADFSKEAHDRVTGPVVAPVR